jgi:Rrf2 family protein
MQLSKKSEYALRALLYMAKRPRQAIHTIQEISGTEKIPTKFLEQILLTLKQGGYLASKRGLGGGHTLIRPPDQIRVFDIVDLMEGTMLLPDTQPGGESDVAINIFFRQFRTEIAQLLNTHTIADLLQNARSIGGISFDI